jgi:biotin synthase
MPMTIPPPALRNDWKVTEVADLFGLPLHDLLFRAHQTHRAHFDPAEVQISTLMSIKTGGCPEDCGYCPQSVHFDTGLTPEALVPLAAVVARIGVPSRVSWPGSPRWFAP